MRILFTLFICLSYFISSAQVKIGNNPNTIDSTSLLELESNDRVLVVTRVTDIEMNRLTPLNGAIVYNTDQNCLFQFNNNTWNSLCVDVMSSETVTTLVDNNDGSISYTNESGTVTFILKSVLNDNGDGTFTFDNGNGTPITLDVSALEDLTSIVANADGTFSYTDEDGVVTVIDIANLETLTSIALNPDNTNIDYTDEDGTVTQLDLSNIVANLEALTSIVANADGTFSYTDEDGGITIIDIANLETLTSIALNADNTNIDYTDEDGVLTQLDLSNIVANLEALTTIVANADGTFSYTDEDGGVTIIDIANLETLTSIALNADNTNIDYTDEDGTVTQLDLSNIVANLETVTTITDASVAGTATNPSISATSTSGVREYNYTNELGATSIFTLSASITNALFNETTDILTINEGGALTEINLLHLGDTWLQQGTLLSADLNDSNIFKNGLVGIGDFSSTSINADLHVIGSGDITRFEGSTPDTAIITRDTGEIQGEVYGENNPSVQVTASKQPVNSLATDNQGNIVEVPTIFATGKVDPMATAEASFNSTVVRNSAGIYTVSWTLNIGINYIIQLAQLGQIGVGGPSSDDPAISYFNQTGTSFQVQIGNNDNGGSNRALFDSEFMYTVIRMPGF